MMATAHGGQWTPTRRRWAASIDVGALPLSPDEKDIAERTSVPIPFLPVCRIEERKLFADLVITLVGMGPSASTIDYDALNCHWH